MVPTDHEPPWAASHECFAPMCELLHTVSANQTCNSTILLFGRGPLALNAQRPPITGVPHAQIGGPLSAGTRLRSQGRSCGGPRRFRTIQVCSEKFRPAPRPCPSARWQAERAAETLRGPAAGWSLLGVRGKVRHEAPRVHYTARQRGRVAARGERAANAEAANHRVPEPDDGFG